MTSSRRSPLFAVLAAAALLGSLPAAAAASRVFHTRVVPPVHDLGGESAIVVHATGDRLPADAFLDTLVDRASRSGLLRLDTADRRQLFTANEPDDATMQRLRRIYPRAVYLDAQIDCTTTAREGEGSTTNNDGVRVKRKHRWIDARCAARIIKLDPASGDRLEALEVAGEGTSARVVDLTDEERTTAIQQAAHQAGFTASEQIAPRQVRESVELVESVPEFDRVMSMIAADRLREARSLLESALEADPDSGAIHFDIAAVAEAMGDHQGAREHFRRAIALAPGESRFAHELRQFERRLAGPGAARKR